ncbi:unnamed protein product [Mucor hiemalis]
MSFIKTPSILTPQGGASLMIAFRCNRKNILVIGYDEIAASRVLSALEADAKVTLVGPLRSMCNDLLYRIGEEQVEWLGEHFEEEQLIGNHLVFVTRLDDIKLCRKISNSCCAKRIPVNVANHKELSDFDMTSTYRDQSLQVAVSTNALSSVNLADRILLSKISPTLTTNLGEAVKNVGILRKRLEALHPGSSSSFARYQWLSHICEYSSLNRLSTFTSVEMDELLKTFNNDTNASGESGQFNQLSTSSPITFLVQNDAMIVNNDMQTKSVLDKANVFIADADVLEKVQQEFSSACTTIQTATRNLEELNRLGLITLEAGKRVVRVVSSFSSENEAEVLFYRSHGYIPLLMEGEFLNKEPLKSNPLIPIPV